MVSKESVANLVTSMEGEVACLEEYIIGQKAFSAALKDRGMDGPPGRHGWARGPVPQARGLRAPARPVRSRQSGPRLAAPTRDSTALALLIQEPERTCLTDLYRRLKLTAMRAKFENKASESYASGSRDLLGAILEELFPEKRGRIYGPSGRAVAAGHDSLVLNTAPLRADVDAAPRAADPKEVIS